MKVVTSRPQRLQPDTSRIKQLEVRLSNHDVNKRCSGFLITVTSAPSRLKAGPKSVGASVPISSHGRLTWVELGSAPASWEIHGERVHWGHFVTMLWCLSLAKRAVRMLPAHTHTRGDLVDLVGLRLIKHGHLDCLLTQDSRGGSRGSSRAELGKGVCRGQDELHGLA